ncbi:relaxase/mobilization nuclease domain-containing protein [Corynebacterium falsenii]|uniref:relaxase/mobilization nuclease domain-containing protein n=1 Tax=Corynebacterium falsenii TaxID=108486 RepID=UPI001CCAD24A|nr:relaxase/mobilization nuclease domain-containing protein [Corynebacterium falsenii]UBI07702.1 relaxase/mobilization nuclease domain-containing protein [Corynebacterium falsenii]
MSVTHIRKIAHTRSAVEYEVLGGKGTRQRRENIAAGTDRIAAITCDRATADEFVDHAELMAAAHGRKVETLSLIQSFPAGDFDVGNRDDIQAINDLGYMLAKRLYPDSDALVITHLDGAGGHPHNHIKVINHDKKTGKVPTNTLHWQVAKANDLLMREHSLRVTERGKRREQSTWEHRRDGAAVTAFEQRLGDQIEEILADETTSAAIFKERLAERGIELVEKRHTIKASADGKSPERESVGWTYKMRDETGDKPRIRRRKASVLSDEGCCCKVGPGSKSPTSRH